MAQNRWKFQYIYVCICKFLLAEKTVLKQVGTLESALKEQLVSAETVLQPAEMSEDMSEKESDEGRADRTGEAREDGDKE